jgi:hypothetical protein
MRGWSCLAADIRKENHISLRVGINNMHVRANLTGCKLAFSCRNARLEPCIFVHFLQVETLHFRALYAMIIADWRHGDDIKTQGIP